MFINIKTIP